MFRSFCKSAAPSEVVGTHGNDKRKYNMWAWLWVGQWVWPVGNLLDITPKTHTIFLSRDIIWTCKHYTDKWTTAHAMNGWSRIASTIIQSRKQNHLCMCVFLETSYVISASWNCGGRRVRRQWVACTSGLAKGGNVWSKQGDLMYTTEAHSQLYINFWRNRGLLAYSWYKLWMRWVQHLKLHV